MAAISAILKHLELWRRPLELAAKATVSDVP
jgi:hypothetical protein